MITVLLTEFGSSIIPSKRKHCTPALLANNQARGWLSQLKNVEMEMGRNPKLPEGKRPNVREKFIAEYGAAERQ